MSRAEGTAAAGDSGGGRRAEQGRKRPEKHTAFFRLLEACGGDECPVCQLSRRRMEQYFEGLLYEKVNDREIRRRFRAAGGFCNPHSHQFTGYHDALAGSILFRDLLSRWLEGGAGVPVQDASGFLRDCPACREKVRLEDSVLSLIVDFLADEQLRTALVASAGLCFPHLARLEERLQAARRRLPAWLRDRQRALAQETVGELGVYVDSCNFSLGEERPEATPEQERAWKRALLMFAGYPAQASRK